MGVTPLGQSVDPGATRNDGVISLPGAAQVDLQDRVQVWLTSLLFFHEAPLRFMRALFERLRNWWQARRTRRITEEAVRDRVQRGASYLDEVDPGWHRRVNADVLELEDGQHCVLGQLHGEFRLGLGRSRVLTLSSAPRASLSPVAYGFKCVEGVSEKWKDRDYELLTKAWREAVRVRTIEDQRGDGHVGDSVPALRVASTEDPSEVATA